MNAKVLPHAAYALPKSLNGRPCFKLNFKPPIRSKLILAAHRRRMGKSGAGGFFRCS
jgi:hypothetical protein